MAPVKVNLNVSVDASGNVEVFGFQPQIVTNPLVCAIPLSAADLYTDASDCLIEFWEPSGALIGQRRAALNAGWTKQGDLEDDLNAVIVGYMDASGAVPFDTLNGDGVTKKYTSDLHYYTHESFGRLALSAYAHYLFGHVAATAAITNDEAFINTMNGVDAPNADLAKKLVAALLASPNADNDGNIRDIAEQVIGQDAQRAKDVDNNELAPDVKQGLQFIAGDIIYMNINLKAPIVSVGTGQTTTKSSLESAYANDISYTLQITLE